MLPRDAFNGESFFDPAPHAMIERVATGDVLHRVLQFLGRSIDDVKENPFVRAQVLGFVALDHWVKREVEISELERQWNSVSL